MFSLSLFPGVLLVWIHILGFTFFFFVKFLYSSETGTDLCSILGWFCNIHGKFLLVKLEVWGPYQKVKLQFYCMSSRTKIFFLFMLF